MTTGRMSVALAAMSLSIVCMAAAAPQQPIRVTDQQVRELLNRIDARTETFRLGFDRAIERSRLSGSRAAEEIGRSINDLKQATVRLRDRVNLRRSDAVAVEDVLRPAAVIDTFVMGNQLGAPVERDWQDLRRDLDELARAYGVAWNATASQTRRPAPVQQVNSSSRGQRETPLSFAARWTRRSPAAASTPRVKKTTSTGSSPN